jgi:hypothetical protein
VRLNVACVDPRSIRNFLFEIGDDNIEGAPGQKIRVCVLKACLRQLTFGSGAGQICDQQPAQEHDQGEHNDESGSSS